ncbi:unnamed protein product [Bursaphelenchus okinawaensis]|uniref:Ig-like domain-containing protein n=1 Tax=Bursaphelenchus okinawaensis TaxID=465554 RepID=A0A811L4Q4_9BILA|nr:unnamed protein product [Bursaphelenchus okinawaensis]CAG9119673.1 unnamed protein product [Bursaphelenchus okinawaensis]
MSAFRPDVHGSYLVSKTNEEEQLNRVFTAGECRRASISLISPDQNEVNEGASSTVSTNLNRSGSQTLNYDENQPYYQNEGPTHDNNENKDQNIKQDQSFRHRTFLRGRMISHPSDSPIPSLSSAELITDQAAQVFQGWEMRKIPQTGRTLGYFYPYPFEECHAHFVVPESPVHINRSGISTLQQLRFDEGFEALMEAYRNKIKYGSSVIEKTIFEVSDSLMDASMTRVHNEVNQELLRSRIAETILNLNASYPAYYDENLKPSFDSLEKRIRKLEDVFIKDEDKRIEEELREINMLKSEALSDKTVLSKREDQIQKRFDNVARMTPLIHMVKQKVDKLHVFAQIPSKGEFVDGLQPLLHNINTEMNVIHKLCRQNNDISNINKVVKVLSGVCSRVDSVLDEFNVSRLTSSSRIAEEEAKSVWLTLDLQRPEAVTVTKASVKVQENAKLLKKVKTDAPLKNLEGSSDTEIISKTIHEISTESQLQTQKARVKEPTKPNKVDKESATLKVLAPSVKNQKKHSLPTFEVTAPEITSNLSEMNAETLVTARRRAQQKDVQGFIIPGNTRFGNQFLFDDVVDVTVTESQHSIYSEDENTLTNVPILFCKSRLPLETAILSDDESDEFHVINVKNSCSETFCLKKHRRNYRVSAFVYPAVSGRCGVTISDNNYQVDVEQEQDAWKNSATIFSNSFFSTEVYIEDSEHEKRMSVLKDLTEANAQMSVSIDARSFYDGVDVNLNLIPYYGTHKNLASNRLENGSINNSALLNVTVSEHNDDVASSHRSSQKSLVISEYTALNQHSFDVPTYIVKNGSTASITCELNKSVQLDCKVEWFVGKKHIRPNNQKYMRSRELFMEVLIINDVTINDSELYSISIDNEIYPVAYLIVENANMGYNDVINQPETMFVMEGETAILSCRLPDLYQYSTPIKWVNNSGEVMSSTSVSNSAENKYSRVIIGEVTVEDQGCYMCYVDDVVKQINLVVEERIDEREVQVSSAETDNEDLNDYLVPLNSTATIACELESTEKLKTFQWRKDNQNIICNQNSKYEHVINGFKHYLIIHNAQVYDSGVYSVLINSTVFKVAQLTISQKRHTLYRDQGRSFSYVCI